MNNLPIVVDVRGDGNCFFRALYGAAKDHGLLEAMTNSFASTNKTCWDEIKNLTNDQEDAAVKCIRNWLADNIMIGNESIRNFLDMWRFVPEDLLLNDYGLTKEQLTLLDSNPDLFIKGLSDNVRKMGTWVSHLETSIVIGILKKGGIDMRRPVSNITQAPSIKSGERIIQLINYNGNHYKYVRYPLSGGRSKKVVRSRKAKK